jgi:phage gp16-like protein
MDRACGAHGEEEKSMRNLKGKDSCKDLGVDEIIILKLIIKK